MPPGVTLGYWRDTSRTVKARLNTLLKSAVQGSILILLLLTLFLRFWVAVWVFVGVPVAILGGIGMMSLLGVTINLLSLFAFILVLGIVVDDAIVTGESIYTRMRRDADLKFGSASAADRLAMLKDPELKDAVMCRRQRVGIRPNHYWPDWPNGLAQRGSRTGCGITSQMRASNASKRQSAVLMI